MSSMSPSCAKQQISGKLGALIACPDASVGSARRARGVLVAHPQDKRQLAPRTPQPSPQPGFPPFWRRHGRVMWAPRVFCGALTMSAPLGPHDLARSAAAWDTVEELSAAAAHAKADAASPSNDPLEKFCDDNPDADECRCDRTARC